MPVDLNEGGPEGPPLRRRSANEGGPESPPLRRRSAPVAACVVVVAAVVAYAPTIHDYFLQDDFGVVGLLSQKPAFYFPRWFVGPWTDNIWGYVPDEVRPFPALSYQEAAVFGAASPEPNHVLNIAIHALNGLLVMWIAQTAAGIALVPAMFAGLVFELLPIQAESVAWITGRVDSLPACFYFASFLLYVRSVRLPTSLSELRRARKPDATETGTTETVTSRKAYLWSVTLFFAALFSKQNTITMAPALVLYDWLVRRRRLEVSWRWLRPYVPYVLLTAGFLLLRYVLFHEVAREDALSMQRFHEFVSDSSRHLVRLVFGGPGIRHWTARDTAIVACLALLPVVRAVTMSCLPLPRRTLWRAAIYFGVVWIALGMAPILVSGYYSPRHMYLASLGWAVAVGIALDTLGQPYLARRLRPALIGIGSAVTIMYGAQLYDVVRDWHMRAVVSRAAVAAIEREAMNSPDGTLLVVGVPTPSWAFAVPHALRPPFTRTDLTRRVLVISDSTLHCCDVSQWNAYTRQALRTWQAQADHPPVVAMYWDARTARLSRVSDRDDPQLRTLISLVMETDSRETLDSAIRGLLKNFVAVR